MTQATRIKIVPLSDHIKEQIEDICDAFEKGFEEMGCSMDNPYNTGSALHYAYAYGDAVAAKQANKGGMG